VIGMQPMGGTKAIAPGHLYLGHPYHLWKNKSQGHSFVEQPWPGNGNSAGGIPPDISRRHLAT
jgi:hypothetical protein